MKSTEFLIENSIAEIQSDYELPDEIIKLACAVRKDCKQYLNENPEPIYNALYRGIGGKGGRPNLIKKNVRLGNRDPSDMPTYLHMEINQYFKDYQVIQPNSRRLVVVNIVYSEAHVRDGESGGVGEREK